MKTILTLILTFCLFVVSYAQEYCKSVGVVYSAAVNYNNHCKEIKYTKTQIKTIKTKIIKISSNKAITAICKKTNYSNQCSNTGAFSLKNELTGFNNILSQNTKSCYMATETAGQIVLLLKPYYDMCNQR